MSVENDEYRADRWRYDIQCATVCIILVLAGLVNAVLHDWSLFVVVGIHDRLCFFLWGLRGVVIFSASVLLYWLHKNKNCFCFLKYDYYIFIWVTLLVISTMVSALTRPRDYYLSEMAEIPCIMMLYLVFPQHNRVLRLLPPLLLSFFTVIFYYLYKLPPHQLDFGSVYFGLLLSNAVGIYFSDKMYGKERQLYFLANTDPLTGIYNRRYLMNKLNDEWRRCCRQQEVLSLGMIDIDFFKKFNDCYGHPAGDAVLKEVAAKIAQCLRRPGDIVARYGGEEFLIVLPGTGVEGIAKIGEIIRSGIEGLKIENPTSSISPYLTVSIGVTTAIPGKDGQCLEIVRQCDTALYQAKSAGRNRLSTYHRDLPRLCNSNDKPG